MQFNISDSDYFGNYRQYVVISLADEFGRLRKPVDKTEYVCVCGGVGNEGGEDGEEGKRRGGGEEKERGVREREGEREGGRGRKMEEQPFGVTWWPYGLALDCGPSSSPMRIFRAPSEGTLHLPQNLKRRVTFMPWEGTGHKPLMPEDLV